jgi:hypothetical protein
VNYVDVQSHLVVHFPMMDIVRWSVLPGHGALLLGDYERKKSADDIPRPTMPYERRPRKL